MGTFLSRKEQRKIEEQRVIYRNMKKTAAVLGTTVTAVSAITPLTPIVTVLADEPDSSVQLTDETMTSVETEATNDTIETTETSQETVEATEELEVTQPTVEEANPTGSISNETTESLTPFAQSPLVRASSSLNASNFIETVAQHAVNVASANDLYASVMIAQAIIESGWGQSTLSQAPYHNLFGIKGSYNGQTVYMNTQEYLNGQWVTKSEPFRKYPSFSESFADNAYTLKNVSFQPGVYYYSGAWKSNTNSYRDATAWLTGRYATDPGYAAKLNSTIETYGLTRYDTPSTGGNTQAPNTNVNVSTKPNQGDTNSQYYTVQSGDSIWLIANKHGISMDQLRSWNNLSGDFIYPGQKLIVSQTASSTPNTNTNVNTNTNNSNSNNTTTTGQTYTVQSGDSIWLIANKHGISMDQLRSWNNLSGDFIYPGQKLIVSQTASSTPNTNTNVNTNTNNSNSNNATTTGQTYTVQSGDSIWLIANKHGISMDQLRSWNNLSGDFIYPGQKLIVSQTASSTPNTNTNVNTNTNNSNSNNATTTGQTYTVQSGDSIWLIANKHGISMDQLRSWNNLSGDLIYPGQKLTVKQGTTTSTTTPSAPNNSNNQSVTPNTQKTHIVKSGDSLWGLSQMYNVSIQQLKTLNALSSDMIYVGQTLKVS